MGGIVEGGVGVGTKASPRRAAIDRAQAELSRLEYDFFVERRRELEFLEKGGNPLDFKFGIGAPLSCQSSSHADQLNDQFENCEAKGDFSSAASPLGDSIGSSGRLGAAVACEPNGADNFDGENDIIESEGKHICASRSNNTPSEHSSQLGGSHNVREFEDSSIFQPKKAYRRRNRSKANRDSAKLSGIGIGSLGGPSTSLLARHRVVSEAAVHESPSDTEMNDSTAADPTNGGLSEGNYMSSSKHMHDESPNLNMKDDGVSTSMTSVEPDPCMGREQKITAVSKFLACSGAEKFDVGHEQQREPHLVKVDANCAQTEGAFSSLVVTLKGLDSDTSCTQIIGGDDENTDSRLCTMKNVDSIGEPMEQKVAPELVEDNNAEKVLKDREMADIADTNYCIKDSQLTQSCKANVFPDKDEEDIGKDQLSAQCETKCIPCAEDVQTNQRTDPTVGLPQGSLEESTHKVESHQNPHSSFMHKLTEADIDCSVSVPELQPCGNQKIVADKTHADQILENARNIMAKRKIIEDMSLGSLPKEYCFKTQWDFVLEEMAWMANDFAQERVWKRTAATQLCYRAAFASRLRFGERDKGERDKVVAQTLTKAVMDFWQSATLLVGVYGNGSGSETCHYGTATSDTIDGNNNAKVENGRHCKEYAKKNFKLALQGYAVRFLQLNSSPMPIVEYAISQTPEGASLIGTHEMTYQNQHAEEDLFYMVPHGAMEDYRKSIDIFLVQCLRTGKIMQLEISTSMHNLAGEFECQENGYEEDEGDNAYYLPGAFEGKKTSNFSHTKRKYPKSYKPRSYEGGDDFSYGHGIKNMISIPQSSVKRPGNGMNNVCPIPTKRTRTASRQRVVGPFSSGAAGFMSLPSRTDASSGETNSYQDDQFTLQVGSLEGLEIESGMDYDKQSAFDYAEITAKPKKKNTKHQGITYEQRWQSDCSMQIEQRDHFKRRLESHQIDSNSNNDSFAPHAKKPKLMKQSLENSFENTMSGSVASPVGSEMSNMSNHKKLFKLIGGRNRGRKTKSLKMSSVQSGSGSPWSTFEDQALVVLVHDMGPNWELVSDAINSTLHFKCIFRKPQECKERHAILLEKSGGDGANTEDSGSSQPYPSTLPGIPKGGARLLFQQLRGPVEEDTINSHFEKIILIGQQLHGRKKQEAKKVVSNHSSHLVALSQVIPNNINEDFLTPLDLCDMASSSPDVFSGSYQLPHNVSLPLPNQAAGQRMLASSNTNSSLQGPPGSNLASPSGQVNAPVRDRSYGIPRTGLRIDEQQRIQQYNHLLSSRNIQQLNVSIPGGNDISMPRANMVGAQSSIPAASVAQGISMLGPRDALMMQVSQTNNRGVPGFNGLSSALPSQSASPSGSTYPVHQQNLMQQHSNVLSNSHRPRLQASPRSGSTEQQPFAKPHARDRQLQQQLMLQRQQQLQQHQQFPTQSQLPISTPLQKTSQLQLHASSQLVLLSPLTPSSPISPVPSQPQQKHQLSRHGRTAPTSDVGGKTNQVVKQRQHQPQQQAKLLKGTGSGNTMRQHHPVNAVHLNDLSSNPGSQLEKGHVFPSQSPKPAVPPPSLTSPSSQHPSVKLVNHRPPNIHRSVSQNLVIKCDPQNDRSRVENRLENDTSPMRSNAAPTSETQLGPVASENEPIPGAHNVAPKQPSNSLAPSLGTQRKQLQPLQRTLPNQVVIQQKHQPHLHQHSQPLVENKVF